MIDHDLAGDIARSDSTGPKIRTMSAAFATSAALGAARTPRLTASSIRAGSGS
jgi:hypothetical protein